MLPLLCSRQCSCQHLGRFQRSAADTEDTGQRLISLDNPHGTAKPHKSRRVLRRPLRHSHKAGNCSGLRRVEPAQRLETRDKGRAAIFALLLFRNSSIETPKPHSPTAIGNVGARGKLSAAARKSNRRRPAKQAKASHWRTKPLVLLSVFCLLSLSIARYCECWE